MPTAWFLDFLYLLPAPGPSWRNLLGSIWCNVVWCYLGYGAASIIVHKRAMKELAKLDAKIDEDLRQIRRTVDFQLRAKGCDGLEESTDGTESAMAGHGRDNPRTED